VLFVLLPRAELALLELEPERAFFEERDSFISIAAALLRAFGAGLAWRVDDVFMMDLLLREHNCARKKDKPKP
jgi:hypothetical protein